MRLGKWLSLSIFALLLAVPGPAGAGVVQAPQTVPDAVDVVQAEDGTFYVISLVLSNYTKVTELNESGIEIESWMTEVGSVGAGPPRSIDMFGESVVVATGNGVQQFNRAGELQVSCNEAEITSMDIANGKMYLALNGKVSAFVMPGDPSCVNVGNTALVSGATAVVATEEDVYVATGSQILPIELELDGSISSNEGVPVAFEGTTDLALDEQPRLYAASAVQNLVQQFSLSLDPLNSFGIFQPQGLGSSSTPGEVVTVGPEEPAPAPQALKISQLCPVEGEPGITVNEGAEYTDSVNVTVTVEPPFCSTSIIASNDGGFGAAQTLSPNKQFSWTLKGSTAKLPKTVYVRFHGEGDSSTFTDDIVLDQAPPVIKEVEAEELPPVEASMSRTQLGRTKLKITAFDKVSGVAKLQIKGSKPRKFKRVLKVHLNRKSFVRVFDKAGNASKWRKVKVR